MPVCRCPTLNLKPDLENFNLNYIHPGHTLHTQELSISVQMCQVGASNKTAVELATRAAAYPLVCSVLVAPCTLPAGLLLLQDDKVGGLHDSVSLNMGS